MHTAILIPAYEPDDKLIKLIQDLTKLLFPIIMVVDDGSSNKCDNVFKEIEKVPNCQVIHHKNNQGKGAALKTGINSILNMKADLCCCITVDAYGLSP